MNQRLVNKLNTTIVNVYKTCGTMLLGLILLALLTYLSVQGFFLVSHGWVVPTIVSPTDANILQLNTQAAQQAAARDKLLSERREAQAKLEDAARIASTERTFQKRFRLALSEQREARDATLRRLASLRREYEHTEGEVSESNRAYAGLARGRTEALYGARLVDQEERLTTQHQLAQMAQTNLSLAQSGVELETQVESLQRELRGLDAARSGLDGGKAEGMTPDVLLLEREFTRSALELARAESTLQGLREDVSALDASIARYDALLASIQNSPYVRAISGNLTVAFVPYDNLENAKPGTPLYACAAKMVWCRVVGRVGEPLEGEVSVKHPIRQHFLRGVMVELHLSDTDAAREELLHLGRPPLFL